MTIRNITLHLLSSCFVHTNTFVTGGAVMLL